MRVTIHLVSRREFWPLRDGRAAGAPGDGPCGRRTSLPPSRRCRRAERLRVALADGPRTVKELGELGAGFVGNLGLWVDLVRVPPSGTWERRRADRLALAEHWVGPSDTTEEEGLAPPRPGLPARVRACAAGRTSRRGRGSRPTTPSVPARSSTSSRSATRRDGRWSTSRRSRCPTPARRHRSGSCPIGTPTCSSTRGGRASCPSRSGRGSSAPRTRSRSGPTWSMARWLAPGRSGRVAWCSIRIGSSEHAIGGPWRSSATHSRRSSPERLNASVRRSPAAASVVVAGVERVGWPGA